MKRFFLLVCFVLAGCADEPPPVPLGHLTGPAKWCMRDPEPIARVKAGDDATAAHGAVIVKYGELGGRDRCKARWIRKMIRKGV